MLDGTHTWCVACGIVGTWQVDSLDGTGNVVRICCLAADTRYGLLAAGSADGRVTVFKCVVICGHWQAGSQKHTHEVQTSEELM